MRRRDVIKRIAGDRSHRGGRRPGQSQGRWSVIDNLMSHDRRSKMMRTLSFVLALTCAMHVQSLAQTGPKPDPGPAKLIMANTPYGAHNATALVVGEFSKLSECRAGGKRAKH